MSAAAEEAPKTAIPLADVSELDQALRRTAEELKACLKRLRPADVGRDISRRSVHAAKKIIDAASDRRAAMILRSAHHGVSASVIGLIEPDRAGRILAQLPTEPRNAILGAMNDRDRQRLEAGLAKDDREFLDRTLRLNETAVGRIMSPRYWSIDKSKTVGDALAALRANAAEIEVAANCYVVDEGKLVGVIALREAAVEAPEKPILEAMAKDPISVRESSERSDAAEIIQTHDFLSLPVVDAESRLIGVVRVDDLFDVALERGGVGILNQGGVAGKVAARLPYFQISMFKVVRSRITWLVLLFVAETLTGTVLRYFEDELARVVALSFFIPLLIGTGGNAGSQTVSTVIRALALGEVRPGDVVRVVLKEVSSGLILGILLGAIAYGRALVWGWGTDGAEWLMWKDIALCVGITVLVVCTWANLVGAVIPITAQKLRIDPTVISGPLITTLVDASGLFIYLSVAHLTIVALRG